MMGASTDMQTLPLEPATVFDPFYVKFKHRNELPLWLRSQYDIIAKLEQLMAEAAQMLPAEIDKRLKAINDSIAAYNAHVPNIHLRKPVLTAGNWQEQYDSWL